MKVTSQKPNTSMVGSEALAATGQANKSKLDKVTLSQNAATPGASAEKVNLSQRVQDMQKIKELATPSDTIDEAKVARLQKLIDEGQYKLDADAIADRMIDEHLNLPS